MLEEHLIKYILAGCFGLLLMLGSLKFAPKTRKILQTIGVVIVHAGIIGILYHKASLTLFISFVCLVVSVFILFDPLKIAHYFNRRIYRAIGWMIMLAALAFATMYVTNFPAWLWAIPLVLYITPHLLPTLRNKIPLFHFVAWICAFLYISLISYGLYSKFNPNSTYPQLTSWFTSSSNNGMLSTLDSDQEKLNKAETISIEKQKPTEGNQNVTAIKPSQTAEAKVENINTGDITSQTLTSEGGSILGDEGPFLRSVREADRRYLRLKEAYRRLRKRVQKLENQNEALREKLDDLQVAEENNF